MSSVTFAVAGRSTPRGVRTFITLACRVRRCVFGADDEPCRCGSGRTPAGLGRGPPARRGRWRHSFSSRFARRVRTVMVERTPAPTLHCSPVGRHGQSLREGDRDRPNGQHRPRRGSSKGHSRERRLRQPHKGVRRVRGFLHPGLDGRIRSLRGLQSAERGDRIVDAIIAAASSGTRGDGIVCLSPVERVWRVRSRSPVEPDEI